jgi:hypothetical protein
MAEAAGLALGVMGIASLFTTCVECFDIVVRARDFSEEFDLLCTQVRQERVIIENMISPSAALTATDSARSLG